MESGEEGKRIGKGDEEIKEKVKRKRRGISFKIKSVKSGKSLKNIKTEKHKKLHNRCSITINKLKQFSVVISL